MVSHVMDFLRAISLFPAPYIFSLSCDTELVYSLNGNTHRPPAHPRWMELVVTFGGGERFMPVSSAYTCFSYASPYESYARFFDIWSLGKFREICIISLMMCAFTKYCWVYQVKDDGMCRVEMNCVQNSSTKMLEIYYFCQLKDACSLTYRRWGMYLLL
jgi:hypothetical protein